MQAIRVLPSFVAGFRLCANNERVRSLAVKPWGIAAVSYLFFGFIAYYFHSSALNLIAPSGEGFWMSLLYGIVWVVVTAMLLILTTGMSIVMALVLSGIFQTDIASHILKEHGLDVPTPREGISELSKMVVQSILTEGIKLIWILPLGTFLLIMGFIPLFTIPAAIGGAWLLAYGSFDIVLDAWGTTARQRLGFAMRNGLTLVAFGLLMMACCLIPFFGLLLPPVAVAGAAHFCAQHKILLPKQKTK